ncbi:class I SAM-dependent methyltransferase [Gordonia sp. (in: high G+C Gram-positive bacteria)]|uniref:class I SAM-dependent methyltransferase n=1 Tax=Gordonia sp. (in: high G+C Gram-positive bacteria) TaxID=84139 RepID=UPI0039E259B8
MDLRRYPDVEGPGLVAVDAADRLILDEAAAFTGALTRGEVCVLDDAYGALTLGLLDGVDGAGEIRVHQDLVTGERALAANAERNGLSGYTSMPFSPAAIADARLVVMRLPRSLDRLAEAAALLAAHAAPDVVVVAGGRIKHMTPRMNEVLGAVFDRVDVTHARQKSRVLLARGPRVEAAADALSTWPRTEHHTDPDLTIAAHGGVFAGTGIDIGTRFLLDQLDGAAGTTVVDLGCGNGSAAAWFARTRPDSRVLATDRSALAVASARATVEANGVAARVDAVRADAAETVEDGGTDLVLLNPPFHSDAALSTGIAEHLFAEARRVLRPGGELWCVWNSHLRYRSALERMVGPTRQIARNRKFTVTASTRD